MAAHCLAVGSACILTTSLPRLSWLLRTSTSDRAPAMLRLSTPASTPSSATPWALWTLAVLRSTSTTTRTTSTAPRARPATFSQHGTTRKTSDVFALATAVLFQSSVQHFAMAPNNLEDAPAWAVDFMKQVPTNWDETRFIDGYPGKYCIMARRTGTKWFVVGITSDGTPLQKKIDTKAFFPKGTKPMMLS